MWRATVLPNYADDFAGLHAWPGPIDRSTRRTPLAPTLHDLMGGIAIPAGWRGPMSIVGAMLLLATLDFLGAVMAKEWSDRGHQLLLIGGVASFTLLFVVYARILQLADLSVVTLGWVVFLQVGILTMDRLHYGVTMPWQKWAAIVVILVLQTYLIVGPGGGKAQTAEIAKPSVPLVGGVVISAPPRR